MNVTFSMIFIFQNIVNYWFMDMWCNYWLSSKISNSFLVNIKANPSDTIRFRSSTFISRYILKFSITWNFIIFCNIFLYFAKYIKCIISFIMFVWIVIVSNLSQCGRELRMLCTFLGLKLSFLYKYWTIPCLFLSTIWEFDNLVRTPF